jgi:prepilin-type N-terminal cleavage/methylation domain-containing protein
VSTRPHHGSTLASDDGFTLVEMLAVVAIVGIMAAMVVPMTASTLGAYRLTGDARGLAQSLAVAKMRAAARFSRARLYVDRNARNYVLQVWDKTAADWITEGVTSRLSPGVSFGFGALAAPPPNTQAAIGFSPECRDKDGTAIANTSCIVFNSRGIPIDAAGAPLGGGAIYLTDGSLVYGTTITATPLVRLWRSPAERLSWREE